MAFASQYSLQRLPQSVLSAMSMRNDCQKHGYSRLASFRGRKNLEGYEVYTLLFILAAGQTDFVLVCPESALG